MDMKETQLLNPQSQHMNTHAYYEHTSYYGMYLSFPVTLYAK